MRGREENIGMSQDQAADIFTKPLKLETFVKLRSMLGVTNQV